VEHGITRDDRIVAGLALLLFIAVLALPWLKLTQHTATGPLFTEPTNRTAIEAPNGIVGVLAAIALAWLLFDFCMQRFLPDKKIPTLRDGRTMRLVLAAVAVALLVLKLLLHASDLTWGFIVAAILAVALLYAAAQAARGGHAIPGR
jgi:hypothetical protein